jgi:hypothetical protein
MTQAFAEILLLVPTALTTGFVLFVAGVIQGVMNDVDEFTFKHFLTELTKHALKSPYVISVSSITFVGMIPYWMFYGFSNRWFSGGLILWVITSIVSKYTTIPIYRRVTGLQFTGFKKISAQATKDVAKLREERRKLHRANILRATLSFLSVALMTIGFIK